LIFNFYFFSLVQWLKYSKKEYCELCKHKFTFAPIYHPDMPKRLPIKDIVFGLLKNIFKAVRFWLHSTLVAISWLAIVPLTACRIYRCLFAGSVSSLLTLPLDMLSTENIVSDILQGGFVVLCSLAAFISLVWLREQILSGGGPDWLENNNNNNNNQQNQELNNVARNRPRPRPPANQVYIF
jgi:E3 ubiquitin-protein ligase MARCH6